MYNIYYIYYILNIRKYNNILLYYYIIKMPDYLKTNSKRCNNKSKKCACVNTNKCSCYKFQSYGPIGFGKDIKICSPLYCNYKTLCNNNQYKFLQYVQNQQDLYANMRRNPQNYPIIPWVKEMNLKPSEQRQYSNMWYRQFGTSQALPANDDFGGFYLVGSEVPYTN